MRKNLRMQIYKCWASLLELKILSAQWLEGQPDGPRSQPDCLVSIQDHITKIQNPFPYLPSNLQWTNKTNKYCKVPFSTSNQAREKDILTLSKEVKMIPKWQVHTYTSIAPTESCNEKTTVVKDLGVKGCKPVC